MKTKLYATVILLWTGACVAISTWFVMNQDTRRLSDAEWRRVVTDDMTGAELLDAAYTDQFNTTGFVVGLSIATGVALIALILIKVWSDDTNQPPITESETS